MLNQVYLSGTLKGKPLPPIVVVRSLFCSVVRCPWKKTYLFNWKSLMPVGHHMIDFRIITACRQVEAYLLSARSPLLITGYASLNTLLDFFARCSSSRAQGNPIRILLGHEPFIHEHQTYASPHIALSEQIKNYWLEQGISLYHSMKIILAIEWLKSGWLQARIGGNSTLFMPRSTKETPLLPLDQAILVILDLFIKQRPMSDFILPAFPLSHSDRST